jgi:3-oxoacyl-[acyl-carrier-protein] synthase I
MGTDIYIMAVGARTPLGLGGAPAAAAVRAGITIGQGEHPFMVDCVGDLMPAAIDTEIDPRYMGPKRLVMLAETALREACESLVRTPRLRLPVYLGLPEIRPGFTPQDAEVVQAGLAEIKELPVELGEVQGFTQGHAAGLLALSAATEQMQRGGCGVCLVGGVDSYFQPDTMEWLDGNRQLLNSVSRSGFIPGEGAGFCLLMTERTRERQKLKALAQVRAVAVGKETKLIKTEDMCFGEGLTATVREAVTGLRLPDERINEVICDMNGERYRGEEWGFVCLRLSQFFDDPTAYRSPAECWGDVGAASGPLFAMLACQAAGRGYAAGSRTLLWASSEAGLRSCAVLEAVGSANGSGGRA